MTSVKKTLQVFAVTALLLASFIASGVAGESPAEEAAQAKIRLLMRENGFEYQISTAPATVEKQLLSQQKNPAISQDVHAYMVEVMRAAFDPARILNRVVADMAAGKHQKWVEEVLAFLATPLGEKITRLEKEASGPEANAAMMQWAQGLNKHPPAKARIALIQALNEVAQIHESALNTALNMNMAIALALESAKPGNTLWDDAYYRKVKAKVRRVISPKLLNYIFLKMLYTYREASDQEMRGYVDFYRTPAGKSYVQTMNEAVSKAIVSLTWEAARKIQVKSAM